MAFNLFAAIKKRISETCNSIYNGWYINCIQTASVYEVLLFQLKKQ